MYTLMEEGARASWLTLPASRLSFEQYDQFIQRCSSHYKCEMKEEELPKRVEFAVPEVCPPPVERKLEPLVYPEAEPPSLEDILFNSFPYDSRHWCE